MDTLIRSVSTVTTALSNVSSVFQLFSFLVVCSGMISKGFELNLQILGSYDRASWAKYEESWVEQKPS